MIADDVLLAAREAVADLALDLVRLCDHDRRHGHPGCPTCLRLAEAADLLAEWGEYERMGRALTRGADRLLREQ